jgi:uncharacterized protein (TIGR00725 family)
MTPPVELRPYVAVVGPGAPPAASAAGLEAAAEELGRLLALGGAVLVCGGLGGVMAAAARGARSARGRTVGILPGAHHESANPWIDVAIPTGLGEARNAVVVRAAHAVVAVGGEYGTLSEIALALKLGTPVVGLSTWRLQRGDGTDDDGVTRVEDPHQAAELALAMATTRIRAERGDQPE